MRWFRGSLTDAFGNRPHWAHFALALLLLLGIVLVLALPTTSVWNSLGQSLLVAGVLGFTVELFVGEATLEYVVDEAFRQATLNDLPDEVQDVQQYLRGLALLRQNATMVWRFRNVEGETDRVTVTTEIRYSVANYGSEQHSYRFAYGLAGTDAHEQHLVRVYARGNDLSRTFHEDGPGLAGRQRYEEHLGIRPNQGEVQNRFCIVCEKVFDDDDVDISFMTVPTLGLSVEVDTGGLDIEVDVTMGHQHIDRVVAEPEEDPRVWELADSLFLPWQAIVVDWKKLHPDDGVNQVGENEAPD